MAGHVVAWSWIVRNYDEGSKEPAPAFGASNGVQVPGTTHVCRWERPGDFGGPIGIDGSNCRAGRKILLDQKTNVYTTYCEEDGNLTGKRKPEEQ